MNEDVEKTDTIEGATEEKKEAGEIVGAKILCDRHGDITKGSLYLHYGTVNEKTGKVEECHFIYCVKCLNEYLANLQKQGIVGKTSVLPIRAALETIGANEPDASESKA